MFALYILLLFLITARHLWLYFVAMMRIRDMYQTGKLDNTYRVLGFTILVEGVVLDVLFNWIFGSLMFLEHPFRREFTFSARVWRWSTIRSPSWRQRLALRIRHGVLDNADSRGYHSG